METQTQRRDLWTWLGAGKEGEDGMYEESNMETYMLPYVKSIAIGNLFYDSEDSNQGSATT